MGRKLRLSIWVHLILIYNFYQYRLNGLRDADNYKNSISQHLAMLGSLNSAYVHLLSVNLVFQYRHAGMILSNQGGLGLHF